jgi:hypothetical protein
VKCPWEDRIVTVAAAWLFFSPFALGTPWLSHPATVTAMACAAMLVSAAAEASPVPDFVQEIVIATVGLALAVSPWLLGYDALPGPTLNAVAVGTLAIAAAGCGLVRRRPAAPPDVHAPGH